jgi:hypothetical protein
VQGLSTVQRLSAEPSAKDFWVKKETSTKRKATKNSNEKIFFINKTL